MSFGLDTMSVSPLWKWTALAWSLLFRKEKYQRSVLVCGVELHFLSPCHCARDVGADRSGWKMWSLLPSPLLPLFLLPLPHHLSKNSWQKEKAVQWRLYLLACQWFQHSHHQHKGKTVIQITPLTRKAVTTTAVLCFCQENLLRSYNSLRFIN